jgi:hypothetical protein
MLGEARVERARDRVDSGGRLMRRPQSSHALVDRGVQILFHDPTETSDIGSGPGADGATGAVDRAGVSGVADTGAADTVAADPARPVAVCGLDAPEGAASAAGSGSVEPKSATDQPALSRQARYAASSVVCWWQACRAAAKPSELPPGLKATSPQPDSARPVIASAAAILIPIIAMPRHS